MFGQLAGQGQIPFQMPGSGLPFTPTEQSAGQGNTNLVFPWQIPQQISLADLMSEVRKINVTLSSQMAQFASQFEALRLELQQLKENVVSKAQFESLETRVFELEQNAGSPEHPDMKFLQA